MHHAGHGQPCRTSGSRGCERQSFGHTTGTTVWEWTSPPRNANAPGCLCNGYLAGPGEDPHTAPVPVSPSVRTVCTGSEQPAAVIRMIGNVIGRASDPVAGIDEIRFTLGLVSAVRHGCDKHADCLFYPGTFPVPPLQDQDLYGFFTAKTGTAKVTTPNPGDQAEITFERCPGISQH